MRCIPHQFRHTVGTRLINNDVPQEVVRRILDHTSTEMTAHYARLHDTTVREHWERARKVNIRGEPVHLPDDSPRADAAWMKHHLGRAAMALPNGPPTTYPATAAAAATPRRQRGESGDDQNKAEAAVAAVTAASRV